MRCLPASAPQGLTMSSHGFQPVEKGIHPIVWNGPEGADQSRCPHYAKASLMQSLSPWWTPSGSITVYYCTPFPWVETHGYLRYALSGQREFMGSTLAGGILMFFRNRVESRVDKAHAPGCRPPRIWEMLRAPTWEREKDPAYRVILLFS